jgi:hypothetical protein
MPTPLIPDMAVAGHVGLELRNVGANYPFERAQDLRGIQPNSGDRDYSRLSCGIGDTQLGFRAGGIFSKRCAPTLAIERHRCKARIGRDFFRSKDGPPAAKPATPLLTLRWTLSAKRASVVVEDTEPDRLAPLAPPAPMGLHRLAAAHGARLLYRRGSPCVTSVVSLAAFPDVKPLRLDEEARQTPECSRPALWPRVGPLTTPKRSIARPPCVAERVLGVGAGCGRSAASASV